MTARKGVKSAWEPGPPSELQPEPSDKQQESDRDEEHEEHGLLPSTWPCYSLPSPGPPKSGSALSREVSEFICVKLLGVATKMSSSSPPSPQQPTPGTSLMSSCCLHRKMAQRFFSVFSKNKNKPHSASSAQLLEKHIILLLLPSPLPSCSPGSVNE